MFTVAVIEDDGPVRHALKFSLEAHGYAVTTFASAEDFLASESTGSACLVVDHVLPGMSGLDLVRHRRRHRPDTEAILITTNPPARLRREAAEAGVPIVEKPLLGDALVERIRVAVQRASGDAS